MKLRCRLGLHRFEVTKDSSWVLRGGGWATLRYACECGALDERFWRGEHAEGRRLTDAENEALGPYPI